MHSGKIISGSINADRVNGLLFDVDGTLSDTDDNMVDRITRFLKPVSWTFKERDARSFARWLVMASETPINFFYSLADRLGIDQPISKVFNWLSQHRKMDDYREDRFWIISGIKDMLADLSQKFPLGVVSARDKLSTNHFLEFFALSQYFDVVVTSQTCEHTKPYPDPVIYAARKMGLDPETCLMIGDTIVDIYAGKSAGAQTAGVLCGFGTQKELQRAGADIILESTMDIRDILLTPGGELNSIS